MKRHGTLLVFKEGVTPQEAAAALEKIRNVLDLPARTIDNRPFRLIDKITEFNPDWGWPTWYVP